MLTPTVFFSLRMHHNKSNLPQRPPLLKDAEIP